MTNAELIRETSNRTLYTQVVCKEILNTAWEVISDELEAHGYVKIPYIGTLDVVEKQGRINIMPDGTEVELQTRMYPRFSSSKFLRKKVRE